MSDDLTNIIARALVTEVCPNEADNDINYTEARGVALPVVAALSAPENRDVLRAWLVSEGIIEQPTSSTGWKASLSVGGNDVGYYSDGVAARTNRVPVYRFTTTGDGK